MPTIEDALAYLGIDEVDEVITANVTRALATAKKTLAGAVGDDLETYLPADPRAKELVLIYLDDLYSTRGELSSLKASYATRRQVRNMVDQLKLELKRAKEAAGV